MRNIGSGPVLQGEAEAFLEGEEPDGLPEATQGDMEGAEIGGVVVETVETEGKEFQLLQDSLLLGLAGLTFLKADLLVQVAEVAAEGGFGDAKLGGQAGARGSGEEAAVDLGPGGVVADGAAFVH